MTCVHYSSVSSSGSTDSSSDWLRVRGLFHASPPSHRQNTVHPILEQLQAAVRPPDDCSCSEWASVHLQVQIVCPLALFLVAGCPGDRVPSHDLLGRLSVVIWMLLSMLRLPGDICWCFRRTHHWLVVGSRVLPMIHHSSLFYNATYWPCIQSWTCKTAILPYAAHMNLLSVPFLATLITV